MRRERRERRRTARRSPIEWAAVVVEGFVDGLLDFLFSWERR
ncbi:hypothetical protein ACGFR8_31590 [Streptomyces brevispora]